jgi:hypothetical protein
VFKESKFGKAKRFTFMYQGLNFRLISQQRVEKELPPSNLLDTKKGKGGFWIELTDSQKKILYQKSIIDPIQTDIEVFSNELQESIIRQKRPQIEASNLASEGQIS